MPSTPLSGVRISWLILARNADLAWLASLRLVFCLFGARRVEDDAGPQHGTVGEGFWTGNGVGGALAAIGQVDGGFHVPFCQGLGGFKEARAERLAIFTLNRCGTKRPGP